MFFRPRRKLRFLKPLYSPCRSYVEKAPTRRPVLQTAGGASGGV